MTNSFKANGELRNGNGKDKADEIMLIEQCVDLNLEASKEEGAQSDSRIKNSITWILLVVFIIQIVGLITTIFVFTMAKPELPASSTATPCCPQDWILTQGSCYHFLELEGAWDVGLSHCASFGASLAVIDSLEKLNATMRHKGPFNHWVGLHREPGESWKWADGTLCNHFFAVEGDGQCAYLLSNGALGSSDCSAEKKWLCSQKARTSEGSHRHCRGT